MFTAFAGVPPTASNMLIINQVPIELLSHVFQIHNEVSDLIRSQAFKLHGLHSYNFI